jgi:RNA polymerase sigma-70 factor, ECF subfamily
MQENLQEALPRGYVAAYRWLGNPDDSRDACQEAAARALASRRSYDPERPFYPWFYRILKNLCIDRIRRRPRDPLATRGAEEADGHAAVDEGGEGHLLQRERSRALNRAVEALHEEQREVIELRHFQDLSYEEMAEILGCPVGTVMSRLYRARRRLRQLMLAEDPGILTGPGSSEEGAT